MKKLIKRTLCGLLTALVITALPVCAFAATDDIDDVIDEAEVYLDEFVYIEPYAQGETSRDNRLEGNSTYNSLANAPALAVDIDPAASEPEDEVDYEPSPNTGAPSMMLPIGIGLMAAGCIPVLMRKIRSK